jgi:hypothetical protein
MGNDLCATAVLLRLDLGETPARRWTLWFDERFVVDKTTDGRLAAPVQCRSSPHELLYFDRPEATVLVDILSRYPVLRYGLPEMERR